MRITMRYSACISQGKKILTLITPYVSQSLLAKQRDNGSWSIQEGEVYSTGMAILILGVPYRFLPIYQR